MATIIMENSEKFAHTLKLGRKFIQDNKECWNWKKIIISRCKRCSRIFMSETDRKYCSEACQYNRKEEK